MTNAFADVPNSSPDGDRPSGEENALLICNGEMTTGAVLRSLASQLDFIVCADGGANAAHAHGLRPDVIIGDFDSITNETRGHYLRAGVSFIHQAGQNDTDFEKALLLLREKGMRTVAICGVTGKLLDHTLGNFSILLRYVQDFRLVLFDMHYRVDVITGQGSFPSMQGSRVSIVPLSSARGVQSSGLRYPLNGEQLAFGIAEGTCNEALGETFTISSESGVLLVFRELHEGLHTL
ncbi:MAG: thiamine diphosphokinase [Bacteroidetes bacterium]|nr:thiamine diphosphokinase [Bacteroidota bacterium]